jgi:Tol biopolymer transport system component
MVNANGTGLTALTTDTTDDWYPDWSPDGSTIVWTRFQVVPTGTTPKSWLWAMNADGTGPHQLAPSLTLEKQLAPGWCPDGLRIAFAGSPTIADGTDIYTVGSTGTGPIQLTTTTSSEDDFFPDCGG